MYEIKAEQLDDHSCWTFDCPKCGADHRVGIETLQKEEFMCSECGEWMLLKSNLTLIAASPKLLKACKDILACINSNNITEQINNEDAEKLSSILADTYRTITEAEGR